MVLCKLVDVVPCCSAGKLAVLDLLDNDFGLWDECLSHTGRGWQPGRHRLGSNGFDFGGFRATHCPYKIRVQQWVRGVWNKIGGAGSGQQAGEFFVRRVWGIRKVCTDLNY